MQNYCKTIGALAAVSALVAGNAVAEVDYELHTGYSNEYLFRGLNQGTGLVEVGADVSTEAYGLGLSGGAWYGSVANGQLAGPNNESYDELDLYAAVSKDFGFMTGSIGYIYRNYGDSFYTRAFLDDEQEVYFSVARELWWEVSTSFTYFWGVEGDNDGYSELAMAKSWELNPCVKFNVNTNLGYLMEQGQLTAWTTKASIDWGFAGTAKLSPYIAYALSCSDDVDTNYAGNKNQFVGGVMLSVSF